MSLGQGDSGPFLAPLRHLLSIVNAASRKVPVVKFAYGLIGIAAAGSAISLIVGPGKRGIIVISLTFVGSMLLFVFSRLAASKDTNLEAAGRFLIWVIVVFFSFFLLITTTAFTINWPTLMVQFLGLDESSRRAECDHKISVANSMLANDSNQMSDVLNQASLIHECDRYQAENIIGSAYFYNGDYGEATSHFEIAHSLRPKDDATIRNLADSYLMVGRLRDAKKILENVLVKNSLWNYKMAKVSFYLSEYDDAHNIIPSVPTQMREDGNLAGKSRVLEAAILLEKSKVAADPARLALLRKSEEVFKQGVATDKDRWRKVLLFSRGTKHESFVKECETLGPHLAQWLEKI